MDLCEECKSNYMIARFSCTVNSEGKHHSFDDKPAIIYASGTKLWYQNGERHRMKGPAIERSGGDKVWYLNGKCHREDGPAIEHLGGEKYWYLNGELHRTDGPAIEHIIDYKEWYLNGKKAIQIKNQEIVIGKKIEIEDDIGIVLRNVIGVFYEVLIGNKKVLIIKD